MSAALAIGSRQLPADGEVGTARIETFTVESGFWSWKTGVPPGQYSRLLINGKLYMSNTPFEYETNGKLYMSNTPFEYETNYRIRRKANGNVLIAGLGMGLILHEVAANPLVSSVTVVEKNQDVINLVAPSVACQKLSIICADIYNWRPRKGSKYDVIYFDIWADISTDVLEDMARLHRAFKSYRNTQNPDSWMDSWQRDYLKAQKRREVRQ